MWPLYSSVLPFTAANSLHRARGSCNTASVCPGGLLELRPFVLRRPLNLLPESARGMEWPIGFPEQLSSKKNEVGLPGSDDVIGLRRISNHPDCSRWHPGFTADSLRESGLITRADGNLHMRNRSSGGAINNIHPQRLEYFGQGHGLFHRPAAFGPVRG